MSDIVSIPPKNSSDKSTLNYEFLRAEGLKYIEKLSKRIWTDYNIHDPGITILELLCYAITDLGYRTAYPIEDILASSPDNTQPLKEYFFSACEILPIKPVTLNDYRKLLIDIDGVRNAWVEDTNHKETKNDNSENNLPVNIQAGRNINYKGIYTVVLDIEDDRLKKEHDEQKNADDQCRVDQVLIDVNKVLHENRNLCEDFGEINVLDRLLFSLCAEIDVAADCDIDNLEAQIFEKIKKYFSPRLYPYNLQEMFQKGKTADQIFEGPLLKNGFIDDDELQEAILRKSIRISDVIQLIMEIDGVETVKGIKLRPTKRKCIRNNGFNPKSLDEGDYIADEWKIEIKNPYLRPELDVKKSKITYYKDLFPLQSFGNQENCNRIEDDERHRYPALKKKCENIPIPTGKKRSIREYNSFQNHFPSNYGIGRKGLSPLEPEGRQIQAKQLKAYLLFFDQVLANYLAQLSHVKDLFSLNPELCQTYFTQVVNDIQDDDQLFSIPKQNGELDDFIYSALENNDRKLFIERRDKFLNHLLARFAENMNEYVMVSYSQDCDSRSLNGIHATYSAIKKRGLESKINFLKDYVTISSQRNLGKNYSNQCSAQAESGLERKLSLLLPGVIWSNRWSVDQLQIIEKGKGSCQFIIIDPIEKKPILRSIKTFSLRIDAIKMAKKIVSLGKDLKNYEVKYENIDDKKCYFFVLMDKKAIKNPEVAISEERFESEKQVNRQIEKIICLFLPIINGETLILENILLRPKQWQASDEEKLLSLCGKFNGSKKEPNDAYSFRISVFLPAWPKESRNVDFRRFVERTMLYTTPAHILPKICWIQKKDMIKIRCLYEKWLTKKANQFLTCQHAKDSKGQQICCKILNVLISILNNIHSVYPKAFLASDNIDPDSQNNNCQNKTTQSRDLKERVSQNQIILDKTYLGTM